MDTVVRTKRAILARLASLGYFPWRQSEAPFSGVILSLHVYTLVTLIPGKITFELLKRYFGDFQVLGPECHT